jgi:DNA-directed RNA polymerase specialized sigma24 family protein
LSDGWQDEEAAHSLGKSVGSVKALQHGALAALQRILIGAEAS